MNPATHLLIFLMPLLALTLPVLMLAFGAAPLVESTVARNLIAIGSGVLGGTAAVAYVAGMHASYGIVLTNVPLLRWAMIFGAGFGVLLCLAFKANYILDRRPRRTAHGETSAFQRSGRQATRQVRRMPGG